MDFYEISFAIDVLRCDMIRGRTSMKYVFQIMRILKVYIESFTSKTSKKG